MRRIGAFVLAGVIATGCQSEGDCPTDWCGTIVVTSGAEGQTLFPPSIDDEIEISLNDLIFEKLAEVGPSMNTIGDDRFIPILAESWSYPDAQTIRFSLSDDARWHDGTSVTARDVAFTFDVYRDPVVASGAAARLQFVESVTAVDHRTVDVVFERPYPEMFFDAVFHVRIIPSHILGSVPRDQLVAHEFGRAPVGSGPFRFVRWNAAEFVELAGDESYHRGRPGVPRIVWRFAAGGQQALTQLLAGEADVLNPVVRAEDKNRVDDAPELRTIPYAVNVYAYVVFNLRDSDNRDAPHPLFADPRLRRAVAELVDVEAVVRGVFGEGALPAIGPLTPIFGELYESLTPTPTLTDDALRTLASLGWTDSDGNGVLDNDGQEMAFDLLVPSSSASRVRSAEILQEQLRAFEIQVNIVEMEFQASLDQVRSGRFDTFFGALQHDPSPSSVADAWTVDAFDGFNYGRYTSHTFDSLVAVGRTAADPAQSRAAWREALQTVIDDAPALWIYVPSVAVAVHTRLEDVTIRPDQWSATMWQWRVNPQNLLARDLIGSN